ncbi:hypothetical protein F441_20064, partial [Phytophthora nicotianae CJ01A1]
MAEPPVDECNLTMTDPPDAQDTIDNSNEAVIVPPSDADKLKASTSRWSAIIDLSKGDKGDGNGSPSAEDKATQE